MYELCQGFIKNCQFFGMDSVGPTSWTALKHIDSRADGVDLNQQDVFVCGSVGQMSNLE